MRLIEQFRVQAPDGREHTVACFQDTRHRPELGAGSPWQRVDGVNRYQLDGAETIDRVDDETFVTAAGLVLKRGRRAG